MSQQPVQPVYVERERHPMRWVMVFLFGLLLFGLGLFLYSPNGAPILATINTALRGGTPAPASVVVDPALNAQASLNGTQPASVPTLTAIVTVRTFVKENNGLPQQAQDVYVVLGAWNGGNGTFESAKVQAFANQHGLTSVDVIWDRDAANVSIIFNGDIPLADIQALQANIQSPRIGIVYNNGLTGSDARECMSFTARPDLGNPIRYHIYDRADWSLLPILVCPNPR